MSSKKTRFSGIGPRLVLWSTLLLSFSLICVSTTVYYLLSNSLRKSDQELIMKLAKSYARSYEENGVEHLKDEVSPEVLVSIVSKRGEEKFTLMPEYIDHDFEDEEEIEQIRQATQRLPLKEGWSTILLLSGEEDKDILHRLEYKLRKYVWMNKWYSLLPLIDNDMAEVYTMKMDDDHWIRVGRSSEDREEHLAKIRNISLMVLVPFILLGIIMSFILSRKILKPVKDLAATIKQIKGGNTNARAHVRNSGDEVDQLAEEFNALLEHNEILVGNLKSTIDNVAHDLRTPMTRFRASVENSLREGSKEAYLEGLQDGLENAEDILKLLNAIMDVSEAETQTMKIHQEEIELDAFFERLADLYQYVAEEKSITIESHIPPQLLVKGDQVRLVQVFGNLLDNAIKFSEPHKTVKILASIEDEIIHISVIDEGPGIPAGDLERIWDRLYRGDKSRSTSGLGIGLSVVQAIVKAHNGTIRVESTLGQGARFIVSLPSCNV